MPFCPQCHSEYPSGIDFGPDVCPECDEPLVAAMSQHIAAHDMTLVEVASFPSEPLARMWVEALENEGVRAVLKTAGATISGVLNGPVTIIA